SSGSPCTRARCSHSASARRTRCGSSGAGPCSASADFAQTSDDAVTARGRHAGDAVAAHSRVGVRTGFCCFRSRTGNVAMPALKLVENLQPFRRPAPNGRSGRRSLRMLRFALLPGVVVGVLAFAPVAAVGDVTFGSSLNDSATTVPYQNGWDQTVFNT